MPFFVVLNPFQRSVKSAIEPCSNEIGMCKRLESVGIETPKEEGEGEDVVEYELVGDYTRRSGRVDCV